MLKERLVIEGSTLVAENPAKKILDSVLRKEFFRQYAPYFIGGLAFSELIFEVSVALSGIKFKFYPIQSLVADVVLLILATIWLLRDKRKAYDMQRLSTQFFSKLDRAGLLEQEKIATMKWLMLLAKNSDKQGQILRFLLQSNESFRSFVLLGYQNEEIDLSRDGNGLENLCLRLNRHPSFLATSDFSLFANLSSEGIVLHLREGTLIFPDFAKMLESDPQSLANWSLYTVKI